MTSNPSRCPRARLSTSLAPLLILASGPILASGYNVGTQSVAAQGTANANGAEVSDASIIYTNPAGMTFLEGTQMSVVGTYVIPDVEFTITGQTRANVGGNFVPVGGEDGGEGFEEATIPHLYFSHRASEDLALGLGIFVPFGANADYEDDFAGRYYTLRTDLKTININPSFSIRLDEQTHFGFGINAQLLEGEIGRMVYGPSIAGGIGTAAAQAGAITVADLTALVNAAVVADAGQSQDAFFKVEGDSWSWGFNLGLMHEFDNGSRVGLAYRSSVDHEVKGRATLTRLEAAQAFLTGAGFGAQAAAIATKGEALVNLETPESVSLSVYHPVDEKWSLMGDVTWTGHNRLQEIAVLASPITETYLETRWRTTVKLSLGSEYRVSDTFHLRFGYMYDESPVGDPSTILPTLPDNDRQWFSLGASLKLGQSSRIDLAYSFIDIDDQRINRTFDSSVTDNVPDNDRPPFGADNVPGSSSGQVQGEWESSAQVIGLQYNLML